MNCKVETLRCVCGGGAPPKRLGRMVWKDIGNPKKEAGIEVQRKKKIRVRVWEYVEKKKEGVKNVR